MSLPAGTGSAGGKDPRPVCLEVLAPGPLTTVQDLGRVGYARFGVGVGGAVDRSALRLANRLVGNPEGAAALEVTFGGLALRATAEVVLALAGARADPSVDGRSVGHHCSLRLRPGHVLRLGLPRTGLRTYVGVRGGIAVEPVLGSRATDVLSGLGPPPLTAGTLLPVGRPGGALPEVDQAPVPEPPGGDLRLGILLGPREDWFTSESLQTLCRASWTVSQDSNRVGIRLTGPPLLRRVAGELPTEGVVRGALQVPPRGSPTLFLCDHPLTGGYPVLAVVVDAEIDRAGQARPGQRLQFRHSSSG